MQLRNFTNVFLLTLTANLANGRVDTCLESLWYHNTNSGWSTFLANLAEFFADVRASCPSFGYQSSAYRRENKTCHMETCNRKLACLSSGT